MRTFKLRMWSKEAKKFFYDPENVYDCLKYSQIACYSKYVPRYGVAAIHRIKRFKRS